MADTPETDADDAPRSAAGHGLPATPTAPPADTTTAPPPGNSARSAEHAAEGTTPATPPEESSGRAVPPTQDPASATPPEGHSGPAEPADPPVRRGPHPALIPVMAIGTALAVLLTLVGFFAAPGAGDLVDRVAPGAATAPSGSSAPPSAPAVPPPPPRTEIKPAELTAVTDAHTEALRSGNADGFLTGFDPGDAQLGAERRRLFANLRLLPFTQARFTLETPAGFRLTAADAGRVSVDVDVTFEHQITGVDTKPGQQHYRWTFVRDALGAPLRVTAVTQVDPQSWDLAELVKVERPRVILLAAAVDRSRAAGWADRAERAAKRDAELWKGPAGIPSRFVVFAAPDPATFGSAYGGDPPKGTVAFCASVADADDALARTGSIVGARITWDTDAKSLTGESAQSGVLRHEMGHAMMAGYAGSRAEPPLWVVEGFAEYLEWYDLFGSYYVPDARTHVRSGKFSGRLPADAEIYGDDAETNGINYHLSMTAIRYMAEKYGAAKTFEFVVAVYRQPLQLAAALQTATGLDMTTFEDKWAQWVKTRV